MTLTPEQVNNISHPAIRHFAIIKGFAEMLAQHIPAPAGTDGIVSEEHRKAFVEKYINHKMDEIEK